MRIVWDIGRGVLLFRFLARCLSSLQYPKAGAGQIATQGRACKE
ncbi:hypothetical protein [Christensenella hongkongensis]|nr:hypothetical protein [Christensenella hongkongensis]